MGQRTSEKRGWKYGKSQDTMKSSVETVSPKMAAKPRPGE